jgi:exopolysaccharide production protein ExoZ
LLQTQSGTAKPVKQKLESLQVGRGVAAFMVLLFHSQVLMRAVHPDSVFARMFGFGRTGVDFFFVLSGFLMVYVHRRDFGLPRRLGAYAYKRLTRIYPVYWVLCAVLIPIVVLAPSVVQTQGKTTLAALLMSVFLVPHEGARLIGITWSLEYEVMFYLAFAAFFLSVRFGLACFAVWFLAIAGAAIWGPATLNNFGVPRIAPFILGFVLNLHVGEFILGMVAAWLVQRDVRLRTPRVLLVVALLAAAAFAAYEANFLPADQTLRSVTVAYGVLAAIIVFAVVQTELRYAVRIPRWLTLLGAASYAIYLTHYLVVAFAVVVAKHWPALAAIPAPLLLLLLLPVGLAPGIVLHLLVERPLLLTFASRLQKRESHVEGGPPIEPNVAVG